MVTPDMLERDYLGQAGAYIHLNTTDDKHV